MQRKKFTEPEMTKCEKPLDKVTLQLGCYRPKDPINPIPDPKIR